MVLQTTMIGIDRPHPPCNSKPEKTSQICMSSCKASIPNLIDELGT